MKKKRKLKQRFKNLLFLCILISLVCFLANLIENTFAENIEITIVSNEEELITAISNGGYIQLNNDIAITKTLTVSKEVTLDLNGYMLQQTSQLIVINGVNLNGKTLTINDSRPDENLHYFLKHEDKPWEYTQELEEGLEYEKVTGGIITGGYNKNDVSSSGGGAFKLNNATDYVIINGGTIIGNYAARAGGASYSGAVTMNGGRIIGNAAGKFAGAIALSGDFIMNGGIIEDNYSPPGNNQYNFYKTGLSIGSSSNFTITGGIIKDNIATVTSSSKTTLTVSGEGQIIGNIYLQNGIKANITGGKINGRIRMTKGSFAMSGGEITGGIADDSEINYYGNNGGGISVEGGNFTMSGGSIHGNTSNLNGGGVYVNGGTVIMDGGSIYNNTSPNGGGIYVNSGSVTITSGKIENNEANLNGGGIAIGGSGSVTMDGGSINNNISVAGSGGGIYIADGNIIINDGEIKENKSSSPTGGLGGGICVSNGSITMYDGTIEGNEAINGGGFYLTKGTFEIQNGSSITKNKAENGAGGYVLDGVFNLTGGTTSNNIATENGGGYYIIDTETANLSNGIISNNVAKNGGGFYQTQTNENITSTTLSGTCYVNNNTAISGNGGGVYVDGGSTFRIISGKVIYNTSTGSPSGTDLKSYIYKENKITDEQTVYAKDSSAGVGGGVYIKNGIFTMKNTDGTNGTSAIFGNIASYAADDLFAYGNNFTTFDAIPVSTMEKDDAYLNSTDWFEDYPEGEYHKSLKIEDNSNYVTSTERYKNIMNENLLVKADSVLTTSSEYICITMGANVGSITLKIDDPYVGSDHIFIYTLKDEDSDVIMKISVKQGIETKIINIPIGNYILSLNDSWSWRYSDKFIATIKKGNDISTLDSSNVINLNVVGGQNINIATKYKIETTKYFTKNIFFKIPLDYSISSSSISEN